MGQRKCSCKLKNLFGGEGLLHNLQVDCVLCFLADTLKDNNSTAEGKLLDGQKQDLVVSSLAACIRSCINGNVLVGYLNRKLKQFKSF